MMKRVYDVAGSTAKKVKVRLAAEGRDLQKVGVGELGGMREHVCPNRPDLFSSILFPCCPPLCCPPLFLPFFGSFLPSSPLEKCAVCSVERKATAQSLERGSFRMSLSTRFGKEIPSRNVRDWKIASQGGPNLEAPQRVFKAWFSCSFLVLRRVASCDLSGYIVPGKHSTKPILQAVNVWATISKLSSTFARLCRTDLFEPPPGKLLPWSPCI